jgi:hypothetical protein
MGGNASRVSGRKVLIFSSKGRREEGIRWAAQAIGRLTLISYCLFPSDENQTSLMRMHR